MKPYLHFPGPDPTFLLGSLLYSILLPESISDSASVLKYRARSSGTKSCTGPDSHNPVLDIFPYAGSALQCGNEPRLKSRTPVRNPEPARILVCVSSIGHTPESRIPSPASGNPPVQNLGIPARSLPLPVRGFALSHSVLQYRVRSSSTEPGPELESQIPVLDLSRTRGTVLPYGARSSSTESGPEFDHRTPVCNAFRTQSPYSDTAMLLSSESPPPSPRTRAASALAAAALTCPEPADSLGRVRNSVN